MINRELVSRVKGQLNMLSKDTQFVDRLILSTAKTISKNYISKKMKTMSLYRQSNLFKNVSCVEFEKVDSFNCPLVEFKNCNILMRSKKKLPEVIYSRFGSSVKEVTSIDNQFIFKPSTISDYRRNKDRQGFSDFGFFYISNEYIWIPDHEQQSANINLIVLDVYDLEQMNECSKNCKSVWDYEFIVPSDLEDQVIKETIQQVSSKLQIPEDEQGNLDSNQKTQTV